MEAQTPRAVSRRALMKASATAGIATAAVGLAGPATAAKPTTDAGPTATGAFATGPAAGPVVVHLVDALAGHVEVFTDGRRRQVTDHDLAGLIARAARY